MQPFSWLTVAFLERPSWLSDKKAFSSPELYFVCLEKQKAVICGKEDDNITTNSTQGAKYCPLNKRKIC